MTDRPETPARPEKNQDGPPRAKKPREKPISLAPLSFEEAVRGLLQVKMDPEDLKGKRKG